MINGSPEYIFMLHAIGKMAEDLEDALHGTVPQMESDEDLVEWRFTVPDRDGNQHEIATVIMPTIDTGPCLRVTVQMRFLVHEIHDTAYALAIQALVQAARSVQESATKTAGCGASGTPTG